MKGFLRELTASILSVILLAGSTLALAQNEPPQKAEEPAKGNGGKPPQKKWVGAQHEKPKTKESAQPKK